MARVPQDPAETAQQLDLFAETADGTSAASKPRTGIQPSSPEPSGAAGTALSAAGVPIPRRCPVTGTRQCHRDGCRHYRGEGEGRCAHPEAIAASAKKRRSGRHKAAR